MSNSKCELGISVLFAFLKNRKKKKHHGGIPLLYCFSLEGRQVYVCLSYLPAYFLSVATDQLFDLLALPQ